MTILLTGAGGQVGFELACILRTVGEVVAPGRAQMDLSDLDQVRQVVRTLRPRLIVNAAAYTAVDRAEGDSALAHRINAEAPAVLAHEARLLGAPIVHFSSDYVFDGSKRAPYVESDPPHPINAYGHSKLAGEQAIAASGAAHLILRTSWVYGMRGNNFLLTMLKLGRERDEVRVVDDQHGAPTWSRTIADTTAAILAQAGAGGAPWWAENGGLYHLSCQGQTTWHGFADAIMKAAGLACSVIPISSAEYPTPARRPANSVLSCAKLTGRFGALPAWDQALALCLN